MRLRVLFFARSREVVGSSEVELQLDKQQVTTTQLSALLIERYPGLADVMQTSIFAVNQEYVGKDEELQLTSGDEVAIIPPISGG